MIYLLFNENNELVGIFSHYDNAIDFIKLEQSKGWKIYSSLINSTKFNFLYEEF